MEKKPNQKTEPKQQESEHNPCLYRTSKLAGMRYNNLTEHTFFTDQDGTELKLMHQIVVLHT
jgi:hypothetical protein